MTNQDDASRIGTLISKFHTELLEDWIANLRQQMIRFDAATEVETRRHCRQLLELIGGAIRLGHIEHIDNRGWDEVRHSAADD